MRCFIVAALFVCVATPGSAQMTEAERELVALEDAWALSVRRAYVEALDRIIAADYVGTTATGGLQDKAAYLADFISGARSTYSLTTEDLRVRVYGETAVLTHGGTAEGEYRGRSTSGSYRWTHVPVRRDGRWQAVANHATKVEGPR